MKKLILPVLLLLGMNTSFAQEESRLLINPGRETFVHFPSTTLGSAYVVTFFLPENAVPLHENYPVIVMLGLTPKHAEHIKNFQQKNKALVVGINFEEQDYEQHADKIVAFLSRELLPYVDTNYLTKTGPENRLLAASGEGAARVALRVVQNPHLYGGLFLASPGEAWTVNLLPPVRTLVAGNQRELALAQRFFEQSGKEYGPDFALRYLPQQEDWFAFNAAYLWAARQEVQLIKLDAAVAPSHLMLDNSQTAWLRVWAQLANGGLFHYIALQPRFSPPYLQWDPFTGALKALPGATAGRVVIRNGAGKLNFSVKIKLKKPKKA